MQIPRWSSCIVIDGRSEIVEEEFKRVSWNNKSLSDIQKPLSQFHYHGLRFEYEQAGGGIPLHHQEFIHFGVWIFIHNSNVRWFYFLPPTRDGSRPVS